MKIKIEEAKRKDISIIVKLYTGLVDFHRKIDKYYKPGKEAREGFKKFISRNFGRKSFKVFVAKDKEKVIAYFIGRIKKPKPYAVPKKVGSISDAFVLEKYRGRGVGKLMFEELIDWFKTNKIRNVELSADSRNKIGLAVWKKYGFFEYQKKMRLDL